MQSNVPSILHQRESSNSTYTFEVDSANRISAVSSNWDAFALRNDGAEACAGRILGRPWWEFVVGDEVRMLYTGLLQKVRLKRVCVAIPFRCDGPTVRRFMTMNIDPLPDNAVQFRCELVREEPRRPAHLLSRDVPRDRSVLHLCGWCGKVEMAGAWTEVDEAIRALKLFEGDTMPALSHGICPTCHEQFYLLLPRE